LSIMIYLLFSACFFEPIILMFYWHYEIKYRADEDAEEDTGDAPNEDELQAQIDRNAALDNLPPPEPEFNQANQAPVVQRPDTPLRAQTPFRPQTPAFDQTTSHTNLAFVPPQTRSQQQDHVPQLNFKQDRSPKRPVARSQSRSPEAQQELFSPQPQTPPAAAVAMAEIQRMRQELARAKARAAEQAGSLGSELSRLAPLRPSSGRTQAAETRLAGLQAERRRYPGRDALVRGLSLAPFPRNTTSDTPDQRPGLPPLDSAVPTFGLPPLGSARSPPGGQLAPLAPLGSRSNSETSGSPRGLSALPDASARRFSKGSGGSSQRSQDNQ